MGRMLSMTVGLSMSRSTTFSNMENGFAVPSLTTVLRLAVALGCKVTALTSIFDKVDLPPILPK